MPKSKAVDAYIAKSPEFARPILTKIRDAMHKASPEIEETMKWSAPHFEKDGILAGVAAFKSHVRFGFWKAALMKDPQQLFELAEAGMGFAKLSTVKDLPSEKVLVSYIREAIELNEKGAKVERKPKAPPKPVEVPDDLAAALKTNTTARTAFENFSPSHKREYIEWITEAKQPATREKRLAQTIEWLSEGKPRNWKYMRS
jgi:uncharacterized protein YdeI (YjbR/CyaY-like superfamily)